MSPKNQAMQISKLYNNERKENTMYRCLSSAFLYFLGICMGIGIMAVYTQFVIKTQVASLVQTEQERITEEYRKETDSSQILSLDKNTTVEVFPESSISRIKRQSGGTFMAAHLVGYEGPNVRELRNHQMPLPGNFFRWTPGGWNSFSLMELDQHDSSGTLIVINKRGYYLVYSQVTYSGHGTFVVGHETVRIRNAVESTLMVSLTTQQLASARSGQKNRARSPDSGYHSGVFLLSGGDKIGVRPAKQNPNDLFVSAETAFYFGVCFLHSA